jgi:hypothetical protein
MRLPPQPICKRVVNLYASANDPSSEHEAAVARDMLRRLRLDFQIDDFLLTYIIERQQKSPEEFDPIEIVLTLFEMARIKLTPEQEIVVALWVLHTYVYNHYLHTPRLLFRSYGPGCGKTALMSLLAQIVDGPFPVSNVTAAVIYHNLRDNPRCTFLIDEGESIPALWSGDKLLLNIFNSGHRRGGDVCRVVAGKTVRYPTFAPLALAYVMDRHQLPPQSLSRSIPIEMTENSEGRDGFDPDENPLPSRFRAAMQDWAADFKRPTDVLFPKKLTGRPLDNWRALIELGTVLGYGDTIRAAALAIQGASENMVNALVRDIRRVFDRAGIAQEWTRDLLEALHQLEDAQWSAFFGIDGTEDPHKLTATELYRLLRGKGVKSCTVWKRINGVRCSKNGFRRQQFERVWRDISGDTPTQSSKILHLTRYTTKATPDTGAGTDTEDKGYG